MFVYHLFLPVFYVCMYVYILSYFVNKLEIWLLYLSPIEKKNVELVSNAINHLKINKNDCVDGLSSNNLKNGTHLLNVFCCRY